MDRLDALIGDDQVIELYRRAQVLATPAEIGESGSVVVISNTQASPLYLVDAAQAGRSVRFLGVATNPNDIVRLPGLDFGADRAICLNVAHVVTSASAKESAASAVPADFRSL